MLDRLLFTHYQRLPDWIKHYITKMVFKPKLGKKVTFFGNVLFGPNVFIGDYSYIHSPAQISNIKIGKYCSIARRFSVITSNHKLAEFTTYPMFFNMNSPLRGQMVTGGGGGIFNFF
jgi:acetyltransferase-like isoleucine patch superfamily enzyme